MVRLGNEQIILSFLRLHPITAWKRNAKKQNDCLGRPYKEFLKRREAKNKGEKERYKHLNAEFQRIAERD